MIDQNCQDLGAVSEPIFLFFRDEFSIFARFSIGDRPNPKETENMVDSVDVVKMGCIAKTSAPPIIVLAFDHIPVEDRQPPSLPLRTVGIGRRTGRVSKIKGVRISPDIGAVGADQNGDISLEKNLFFFG